MSSKNLIPIAYADIGLINKDVGTISDEKGKFMIAIGEGYDNDTLKVSCIGFSSFSIKVSDYKKLADKNIYLQEKVIQLNAVIISNRVYENRTIGTTSRFKMVQAGFLENKLGHEMGVIIKINKSAKIKSINLNIATCTYDSIFYRVNIYKVLGKMSFENILTEPIYINLSKDKVKEKVSIDVANKNILVNGDFLVTIEHVKDLGPGRLYFCSNFSGKTFYRKTSQGKWESSSVAISLSVNADVEK